MTYDGVGNFFLGTTGLTCQECLTASEDSFECLAFYTDNQLLERSLFYKCNSYNLLML
jgi:hypothetical protein